jgi:hypothetical protein
MELQPRGDSKEGVRLPLFHATVIVIENTKSHQRAIPKGLSYELQPSAERLGV